MLTIRGGKKRACWSTRRTSASAKQFAKIDLTAQNGKRVLKKKLRLQTGCKKKKKKRGRGKAGPLGGFEVRTVGRRRPW